jgi:type II secretory pathway pseudopilin PulG
MPPLNSNLQKLRMTLARVSADKPCVALRLHRWAGTTFAELLVATVFTGIAASLIIGTVNNASRLATEAGRRSIGLAVVQDFLESTRAAARSGALAEGTTDTKYSLVTGQQTMAPAPGPGPMPSPSSEREIVVRRIITLETGTKDLYKVTVQGTWAGPSGGTTGGTSLSIETYMRSPCE